MSARRRGETISAIGEAQKGLIRIILLTVVAALPLGLLLRTPTAAFLAFGLAFAHLFTVPDGTAGARGHPRFH